MKKLISTCIVLAILRITCQYTETVGVYQTEVTKAEMISAHNDIVLWDAVAMAGQSDWSGVRRLINITNNRREYGKEIDIFYPLLAEYERAWKDKDYFDEYGYIMSDYRFVHLSNSQGYKRPCYALADLADDGSVELVIGVKSDNKYIITTIYSYDGDSIYCADTGVDGDRTLYETGIYEVFIGMRGVALFDYYQFMEDQRQAEFVIGLTQDYEDGKYYKNMEAESSDNIEITEEEFWEIREQYEKNTIELDWQELKGYDRNIRDRQSKNETEEPVRETVIKTVDMYMEEAQAYIKDEDYLAAIEVLMEGAAETGDETLAEIENDLREHIIIIRSKEYADGKLREGKEYDEAGNVIKSISYNKRPDRIVSWTEYEYDSMGNEVKYTCYNTSGETGYWGESKYDENGNRTQSIYYYSDGETEIYEYEYDEAGNMVMEAHYGNFDDKSIGGWYEYEYDKMGNQTKIVRYDYDGSLEYWKEFEYVNDESGRCKKVVHYGRNGDIQYWDEYEYDEKGRRTKSIRCDGDGDIEEWQ